MGWENSRLFCKPKTKWRICVTVKNSPNPSRVYKRPSKYRRKVVYCFYILTFPRKVSKPFVMALIKTEILTSCEVSYTKSCTRNHFLFCKKDAFQTADFFSLKLSAQAKNFMTQHVCKDFTSFSRRGDG